MHIHGCGNPVAVIFREALQGFRNDLVPAILGRQFIEIAESAFFRPVLNVETQHLDGGGRVAGGNAGAQHRHRFRAAAAGDRHIGPGNILRL
ncbi:hypothetical protein D3C72_838020 [compost metagenome]